MASVYPTQKLCLLRAGLRWAPVFYSCKQGMNVESKPHAHISEASFHRSKLVQARHDDATIPGAAKGCGFGADLAGGPFVVLALEHLENETRCEMAMPRACHGDDHAGLLHEREREVHLFFVFAMDHRFPHDRACVLVHTHSRRVLPQHPGQQRPVPIHAKLQKVLQHVIAIRVPRSGQRVHEQRIPEALDLLGRAVLQDSLKDAATILVPCGLANCPSALLHELIDHELRGLRLQKRDALLQHIIGVRAPHALPDMALQLRDQSPKILLARGTVERLLDFAAALSVPGERPDPASDALLRRCSKRGGRPVDLLHKLQRRLLTELRQLGDGCLGVQDHGPDAHSPVPAECPEEILSQLHGQINGP
mmetsp:Transcript_79751/g.221979  ORF Transcript_79751/g.221979 Transcript_79751/m.221979 type:complete len:365 (-) Transcript_79751:136-1230(-)